MVKRTPLPCSAENCGDLFPICGMQSTYTNRKCRCDPCLEANRLYNREHRAKNRESYSASSKKYRENNREALREHARLNRETNREHFLELERNRRERNRESYNETQRKWRESNRGKVRESALKHYHANSEKYRESARAYRAADPKRRSEYFRQYHQENPHIGRKNAQARRARLLKAFVEDVDDLVVFERAGWVCQGCGIDCPKEAQWPDRNAASLDHIIPISWGVERGGVHSYANTQLLCLGCNWSKNNRYE